VRTNNSKTRQASAALTAIAAAIVVAISAAPGAHADEHDDAFMDALMRHGILPMGDPAGVVTWAHWACDQLAAGSPKEHIVVWLGQNAPQADNCRFSNSVADSHLKWRKMADPPFG
jgi:Protein of unknown function (DUF732)